MMIFSRATFFLAASVFVGVVRSQSCPSNDNGQCDFEPTNPHSCGPDYKCGYSNICLAEAAGYDIDTDCCQAPQPSGCPMLFDPQLCGSKQCPFDNMCIAELAGYTASQCSPPPPECPTGGKDCSGEPNNPFTCGINNCDYRTICDAESAGFDTRADCCQDTRSNTACGMIIEPVSCGPPGGKQCGYDNQCLADAAGYNSKQCCKAVPDGIACNAMYEPVECGNIPCVYSNQCEADAAGWSQFECCKQPNMDGCSMEYSPLACSSASCVYDNECIARNAGFDPASCVPLASASTASAEPEADEPAADEPAADEPADPTNAGAGKSATAASVGAVLFAAALA